MRTVCTRIRWSAVLVLGLASLYGGLNGGKAWGQVPGLDGILGMESGDYSWLTYNKSEVQGPILEELFARNEADYAYYLEAVGRVEADFRDFVATYVFGPTGLKAFSDDSYFGDRSQVGNYYTAGDFLSAVRGFNQGKLFLETRIASLVSITRGALPSQTQVDADGSGVTAIDGYANIDFSAIEAFYDEKLNGVDPGVDEDGKPLEKTDFGLMGYLNGLPFRYTFNDGDVVMDVAPNSGRGLVLKAPAVTASSDSILELRRQVVDLKRLRSAQRRPIDRATGHLKSIVQRFVAKYGDEERYRFETESIDEAGAEEYAGIALQFWMRSYMRVLYGLPLGAIGIHYEKKPFSLDFFLMSTRGLLNWIQDPIWTDEDLLAARQSYIYAGENADSRTVAVLSGDASALARINSALTFIGGFRRLAEVSSWVLRLLAADVQEEKMLILDGDLSKLERFYYARYFGNPEDEAFYRRQRKILDPSPEEQAELEAEGTYTSEILSTGTYRSNFEDVMAVAMTKQSDLDQADELEDQIAGMVNMENSPSFRKINDRRRNF